MTILRICSASRGQKVHAQPPANLSCKRLYRHRLIKKKDGLISRTLRGTPAYESYLLNTPN